MLPMGEGETGQTRCISRADNALLSGFCLAKVVCAWGTVRASPAAIAQSGKPVSQ